MTVALTNEVTEHIKGSFRYPVDVKVEGGNIVVYMAGTTNSVVAYDLDTFVAGFLKKKGLAENRE